MRFDRPPPGEELGTGSESPAREAASVIVARDAGSGDGIEVLLVKRNPKARFMGGVWVFPGGSVHASDGDAAGAALRELQEEAGLSLAGRDALTPFSRWITPAEVKTRFDTWFFLAAAPAEAEATCDGEECVDLRWLEPRAALEAARRGAMQLVFPTVKQLERLTEARSVREALESAARRVVTPIQPRVVVRDGEAHVLLPGEPGYDD